MGTSLGSLGDDLTPPTERMLELTKCLPGVISHLLFQNPSVTQEMSACQCHTGYEVMLHRVQESGLKERALAVKAKGLKWSATLLVKNLIQTK